MRHLCVQDELEFGHLLSVRTVVWCRWSWSVWSMWEGAHWCSGLADQSDERGPHRLCTGKWLPVIICYHFFHFHHFVATPVSYWWEKLFGLAWLCVIVSFLVAVQLCPNVYWMLKTRCPLWSVICFVSALCAQRLTNLWLRMVQAHLVGLFDYLEVCCVSACSAAACVPADPQSVGHGTPAPTALPSPTLQQPPQATTHRLWGSNWGR